MKLPNFEGAVVSERKVTEYLLSVAHRDGRHKAAFFLRYGFVTGDWPGLANALLRHASENEIAKTEKTPFGTRYVVEGKIESPSGRTPNIRSVWFVDSDQDVPRFVTAYPLEGAGDDQGT